MSGVEDDGALPDGDCPAVVPPLDAVGDVVGDVAGVVPEAAATPPLTCPDALDALEALEAHPVRVGTPTAVKTDATPIRVRAAGAVGTSTAMPPALFPPFRSECMISSGESPCTSDV